jgi:alkaline phosphatase D
MNRPHHSLIVLAAALMLGACSNTPETPSGPVMSTLTPAPEQNDQTAVPTELGEIISPTDIPETPLVENTAVPTDEPTGEPTESETPTTGPTSAPPPTITPAPADGELLVTHGPIAGEVTSNSVVLWARGGLAGTLTFSVTTPGGSTPSIIETVEVDGRTDYTGETLITGLTPATTYSYTVALDADGSGSRPVVGEFTTAPAADIAAAFSFVMGADIGGQGYCRENSGWRIFDTMLAGDPAFYLMTGDGVYVDTACAPPNVEGSEGPFRDLAGFRSRYKYTLADPHYAGFLSQVPAYATWDDHEVVNDFGGPQLMAINPQLFLDGRQAFMEFWPLMGTNENPNQIYRRFAYGAHADFYILDTRSYRDPNVKHDPDPTTGQPKTMLGAAQKEWLKIGLADSQATWKFIVTSVPLSYPTGFPQPAIDGRDGWANFTEQSGYENELLELVYFLAANDIQNVVFLTADVHWPFALSYDPDRDGQTNFFEFGSGPLSAITLAPAPLLDTTLNPSVLYAEGQFQGDLFNFGQLSIDEEGALTFRIVDRDGEERYTLTLEPEGVETEE